MQLARRLTGALVVAVLLVQTGFGVVRVMRERSLFRDDVARDEEVLGRVLALAAQRAAESSGLDTARALVAEADRGEDHVHVRWVDLDRASRDAASIDDGAIALLRRGELVRRERDGVAMHYTPMLLPEGAWAAVEVSDSLGDEQAYVWQSVLNAALSTTLLVALCGLVSWLLGVHLVGRPIRRLVARARAIGDGDLESTVELPYRDELGELADEMNAMARGLLAGRQRAERDAQSRLAVRAQLEHADRLSTVGTLASGIAHELGTPLNVIEGYAQLIAEAPGSPPDALEGASVIRRQARRMTAIIRQLLDFARRERSGDPSSDPIAAAREVLGMVAPLARKRRVELALDHSEGLLVASIGHDELQQVVSNVVINGIQATRPGGSVGVFVECIRAARPWISEADRDMVRIVVSDEGAGIDAELVERVFEPFFTTKDVGEGTGLGLSVAHGIVSERQGWIAVDSAAGAGSRFSIYIPRAA